MINIGAADNAADELIQLLQMSLADVSQLGLACGDEHLITVALYQLQASTVSSLTHTHFTGCRYHIASPSTDVQLFSVGSLCFEGND